MSKNVFSSVGVNPTQKSKFSLSHEVKLTTRFGIITPFYLQETLPGDSFKVKSEMLCRFAPLANPIFHQINVYAHYFFVPNRLVFEEFDDFMTGGKDGQQAPTHPQIKLDDTTAQYFVPGRVGDYLGVPTDWAVSNQDVDENINQLPFAAYQLIFNEYYREQNLQDEVDFPKTQGITTDSTQIQNLTSLRYKHYEKDYFNSALPYPQKGPDVEIPLATGSESVVYKTVSDVWKPDGSAISSHQLLGVNPSAGQLTYKTALNSTGTPEARIENIDSIAAGIDVNDLRRSEALQRYLETNARAGSRYVEFVQAHFGVRSDDLRIHRPAFLSGAKFPVKISEVLQTAETEVGQGSNTKFLGVGSMHGHGIAYSNQPGFSYSCKEHGFILGLLTVVPKIAYLQQGLNKLWSRNDKLDYYIPAFANLGEQEVLEKEVWLSNDGNKDRVFGYQTRYGEYKYQNSRVCAGFKDLNGLGAWHLARDTSQNHVLNEIFTGVRPDELDRIFQVQQSDFAYDEIWMQIHNNVSALRPMPYVSIPTI